jgi:hypothetical protein
MDYLLKPLLQLVNSATFTQLTRKLQTNLLNSVVLKAMVELKTVLSEVIAEQESECEAM